MKIDILGIAETFWDGNGDFSTSILETKDSFRVCIQVEIRSEGGRCNFEGNDRKCLNAL